MAAVNIEAGRTADVDIENIPPEKGLSNDGLDGPAKYDSDNSSNFKQEGVRKAEAVTAVWTKNVLWITFGLLFLVSFCDNLLQVIQSNLTAYVTSAFGNHGLLGTTSIVSTILGGVSAPAIAKIIDIRGRTEGLFYMIVLLVVGMIMKATCKNVETYAAAQTFYWVGHLGLIYIVTIIISDMTSLRNRALMIAVNATPLIATVFAGPKIAELFYENLDFRWAFGAFTIILVGVSLPVLVVFFLTERKAMKLGTLKKEKPNRTVFESIKFYTIEFDVVGLLLLTGGWAMLLLPFNLVNTTEGGWRSATVICLIVFGVVGLGLFVVWERYFATVQLFRYKFLLDRTVLGGCLVYGIMFLSVFCWDTYYYSYLQVAHFQSIANSGYILNAFSLTSAFFAPLIGLLIRYTGQFKWPAVIGGIPFTILGTALLIKFRTPDTQVGYLVMCQFFVGIGSAFLSTCSQLGAMAAVSHQEVAIVLALYQLFGSIGAAIGQAIAGALWTNLFPDALYRHLPDDSKDLAASIYADIVQQMSYEAGTPIRDGINEAYGEVQRKMVIAGSAFVPLILATVLIWKNINVKEKIQIKGTIF